MEKLQQQIMAKFLSFYIIVLVWLIFLILYKWWAINYVCNKTCGKPKIKEDDLDITQFYRAYNYLYCTFALDKYVLFLRCLFPTTPLVHLLNCTCISNA